MSPHRFTLVVEGPDLQDERAVSALFEAGCADATIGRSGPTQFLDFDREAVTFADAVLGAIEAIEAAIPTARVVHLGPDELVTMAEIAERTGRTRESIRLLVAGERGPGGFPTPATHFRERSPMWGWHDVVSWFADVLGEPPTDDGADARFIAALNAALRFNRATAGLDAPTRDRLRSLVA